MNTETIIDMDVAQPHRQTALTLEQQLHTVDNQSATAPQDKTVVLNQNTEESNQRFPELEMANRNKGKILITTKIVTTLYPSLSCTEAAGLEEEPQELASQQPFPMMLKIWNLTR